MSVFELLTLDTTLPLFGLMRFNGGLLCAIPGALFSFFCLAFQIWMLVECLTKESPQGNDKLVWALVIFLLPCAGSLIYFFIRRPNRRAQLGR